MIRGRNSSDTQCLTGGKISGSCQSSLRNPGDEQKEGLAIGNSSPAGLLGNVGILREIIHSRLFLLVVAFTASGYALFFYLLDIFTAAPAMATPSYFVLYSVLVLVSSSLIGLNTYSFRLGKSESRNGKANVAFGSSSASSSLFGGVISCSCHTSLLLPLLSSVGLSAISGISVISALVEYQLWILAASILLQLYLLLRVFKRVQRLKLNSYEDAHALARAVRRPGQ